MSLGDIFKSPQKKEQEEWMKKQLEEEKKRLGEDFGEDVDVDFSE